MSAPIDRDFALLPSPGSLDNIKWAPSGCAFCAGQQHHACYTFCKAKLLVTDLETMDPCRLFAMVSAHFDVETARQIIGALADRRHRLASRSKSIGRLGDFEPELVECFFCAERFRGRTHRGSPAVCPLRTLCAMLANPYLVKTPSSCLPEDWAIRADAAAALVALRGPPLVYYEEPQRA